MKIPARAWRLSLSRFFSTRKAAAFFKGAFSGAAPVMGVSALIGLGVVLLCELCSLTRYIAHIPVPLIALILGPIYVPPLIRRFAPTARESSFLARLGQNIMFYGVAGLCAWGAYVVWGAYPNLFWILTVLISPVIAALSLIVPFVFIACAVPPAADLSFRALWSYCCVLAWHEFPAAIVTFIALVPFASFFYGIPTLLHQIAILQRFVGSEMVILLQHLGSVLYWQVSWAFFIVLYLLCEKSLPVPEDQRKRFTSASMEGGSTQKSSRKSLKLGLAAVLSFGMLAATNEEPICQRDFSNSKSGAFLGSEATFFATLSKEYMPVLDDSAAQEPVQYSLIADKISAQSQYRIVSELFCRWHIEHSEEAETRSLEPIKIDRQQWADIELIKGNHKPQHSVFSLFTPHIATMAGQLMLQRTLVGVCSDRTFSRLPRVLERQRTTAALCTDDGLFDAVSENYRELSQTEEALLQLWMPHGIRDSYLSLFSQADIAESQMHRGSIGSLLYAGRDELRKYLGLHPKAATVAEHFMTIGGYSLAFGYIKFFLGPLFNQLSYKKYRSNLMKKCDALLSVEKNELGEAQKGVKRAADAVQAAQGQSEREQASGKLTASANALLSAESKKKHVEGLLAEHSSEASSPRELLTQLTDEAAQTDSFRKALSYFMKKSSTIAASRGRAMLHAPLEKWLMAGVIGFFASIVIGVPLYYSTSALKTRCDVFYALQKLLRDIGRYFDAAERLAHICHMHRDFGGVLSHYAGASFSILTDKNAQGYKKLAYIRELIASSAVQSDNPFVYVASVIGNAPVAYRLLVEMKEDLAPLLLAVGVCDAYRAAAGLYRSRNSCHYEERSDEANTGTVGSRTQSTPNHYTLVTFSDSVTPTYDVKGVWSVMLNPDKAIPTDFALGGNLTEKHALVSGPNAGGKTTILKAIMNSTVLAQGFGFAPARSLTLTPFTVIGTYLNIIDDVAAGRSLFLMEVERSRQLLNIILSLEKGDSAFFIVDELYRGTGGKVAAVLGKAVVDYLGQQPGSMIVVATHYERMAELEKETDGRFKNYHVAALTHPIRYQYQLLPGASTQNIAFDILDEAGFDLYGIVAHAREMLFQGSSLN